MATIRIPPFESLVDVDKESLWVALAAITFNPTFWNTVARNGMEYSRPAPKEHINMWTRCL